MGAIRQLSDDIVAKIAAGEVIDRPVAVVKELVENSLDADASYITIEVVEGGLKKIVVSDNGIGMDPEDVLLAFQPHTTSKIIDETSLLHIQSFGFRGEALSSIAAVSRLTIQSKMHHQTFGMKAYVVENALEESMPIGMSDGTRVVVDNLFSRIPARKKFLKSPTSELRHIVRLLTHIAFVFPDVGFSLIHNGKPVFNLASQQNLEERARILLGQDISSQLIPVDFQEGVFRVQGMIGKPQVASSGTHHQYIAINKRLVRNRIVSQLVKETFGSLLDPHLQPLFFLSINLPPNHVDVNVHPKKEEVLVLYHNDFVDVLTKSVQASLTAHDLMYRYTDRDYSKDFETSVHDGGASVYTANVLKDMADPWQVGQSFEKDILQIHNLYLVMETKEGVLVIDQHAAHERILYEQYLRLFQEARQKFELYYLPEPALLQVPLSEFIDIQMYMNALQNLGFDIEEFGHNTYKVTAMPKIFQDRNCGELIREVLHDLSEDRAKSSLDRVSNRTISFLACRMAIKAGDYLTPDQRKSLLQKLRETKTGYTCPHGRPVQLELGLSELHRLFKRIK